MRRGPRVPCVSRTGGRCMLGTRVHSRARCTQVPSCHPPAHGVHRPPHADQSTGRVDTASKEPLGDRLSCVTYMAAAVRHGTGGGPGRRGSVCG